MTDAADSANQSLWIGPDQVFIEDDAIVILARHEIRDWQVREFARQAIFLQGNKYFLRRRVRVRPPFAFRYELSPWPEDYREPLRESFVYDEAFVRERDRHAGREQVHIVVWYILVPLSPLLGLCWSRFKERVLQPAGFPAISITSASTMFTFLVAIAYGIWLGYLGGWTVRGCVLWLVLLLDCGVRYGQVIRGDDVPDGFLEWAFRPLLRLRKPPGRF